MEDFGYDKKQDETKVPNSLKKFFLVVTTLLSTSCFVYVTIKAYYGYKTNVDVEIIESPVEQIKVMAQDQMPSKINDVDSAIYDDIFIKNKNSADLDKVVKVREDLRMAVPPIPTMPRTPAIKKVKSDEVSNAQPVTEKKPITEKVVNLDDDNKGKKPTTASDKNNKILVYNNKASENNEDLLSKSANKRNANDKDDNSKKTVILNNDVKKQEKRSYVKVQVAALSSPEAVKAYWKNITSANPKLFSSISYTVEKIDLGKRGLFYRMQLGKFPNQSAAENFCRRYVAATRKTLSDCIIVE